MSFRVFFFFLASVLVLALLATPAFAQATLEVLVLEDTAGTPVPGVEITLTNDGRGFTTSAISNDQGKARFRALATGDGYAVTAKGLDGFGDATKTGLVLRTNQDASATLRLRLLETFTEGVTVTAERQLVALNRVDAEVSSTLVEEELEILPIEGRDVTRSLYRLPNVTQATGFYPEAPNVSINGANSLFTNYMIDGLDNNENFLGGQKFAVPVGAVQDVTVLTSSYSAEFGRTGNGVFNVTTKNGGNDLQGEVFYLSRPGENLDASTAFPGRDLSGNQVQDGFKRDQLGFSIGGPIRKDRTFFFANVEGTRDEKDNVLAVPELGIADTVSGTNEFLYATGRFDHQLTDSIPLTARLNYGDVNIERQGGGLDGGVTFPSAGSVQDRESLLGALRGSWISSDIVNEASVQFSRFRWNYGRPLNGDGPQATVLGASGQTVAVLGHPGFVFDDIEETVQLRDSLSFILGDHTLTMGADIILADFALTGGGNVDGNYLVQLTQEQEDALAAGGFGSSLDVEDSPSDVEVVRYDVELLPNSYGETQELYSFYVEDLFSVTPRLNLSLGLRYDYDSLSESGSDSADTDNFAPRVSFNYQIDDDSVLRGGFGLFYEKIVYAAYSDALQQNSSAVGFRNQLRELIALGILPADTDIDRITFDGNLVTSFDDVPYLGGPTPEEVQGSRESIFSNERRILNPDGWDNPVTEQYSLGYQRQVRSDMLFYVDLIYTQSRNLFRLRDLNAPAPYTVDPNNPVVRSQEEADATRPVDFEDGGARNIVVSETEGEAEYRAATFTFIKYKADDWYNFRLGYTWSKLENNTDDINFRAQDSNDFEAEWGPSVNDREHVISAVFQVHPLDDLSIALTALLQSGQPVNRIPDATVFGTTDLNGDGRSFGDAFVGNSDRFPGEPRNSDRLPWSQVYDLGIQYQLPIRDRNVELRLDVFNLLNNTNLSGFSNNATQSNQIQIGPAGSGIVLKNAAPPRQFQLGVRFVF
ncbi:MAG: TonB-dependent receptor [Acidobacteriota bacterium]